jgi:RNA polymerase sigma factor (sigma-70 family)
MRNNESELISQAREGDTDAFCRLAERYQRRIYALAAHYCQDAHDAEDLSQEVWLRAYKAIHGFRAESSFYTWLRQITINCFLNDRRSQKSRREHETPEIQRETEDGERKFSKFSAFHILFLLFIFCQLHLSATLTKQAGAIFISLSARLK